MEQFSGNYLHSSVRYSAKNLPNKQIEALASEDAGELNYLGKVMVTAGQTDSVVGRAKGKQEGQTVA